MIAIKQNFDLLQFLPTMAWTNLPNGEVTFYNKKWSDYTGIDMSKINKWAPESITHAEDAFVSGLFIDQLDKGVAFEIKNRYKHFNGQYRWHLNRFEPIKDENGNIYLWIGTATDIEDKKRLEDELAQRNQKYEEGEIKFIKLIMQSTFPIAVYRGKELIAEIVNDAYFPIVGKTREEFVGKPLFESLPEAKEGVGSIIEEVMQTANPFKVDEFGITMNKFGKDVFGYYSFIFEPVRDQYGKIDGVMTTAIDITEKVLSRKAMEDSEAHLQLLRDTVPAMIFYLDKEMRYQSYNTAFMEWFEVDAKSVIGKTVNEFLGEAAYNKTLPYLTKAYAGEQVKYEMAAPSRMGKPRWLSIVYTPHINNDGDILGIIVHATDVSDSKKTEISLRESELRFRSLVNEAPVATCLFTGREMKIVVANEMILKEWGKDASVIGMRFEDAVPELKGQPFFDILDRVFTTGIAHSESAARAEVEVDGVLTVSYYNFTFKPLFDENGEVYGIMDMAYNVTEQVLVQQRIEESRKELLSLFEDSPIGIAMINTDELVFKMANKFYSGLAGLTPEEMIGRSLLEVAPELENQCYEELLKGVINNKLPLEIKELPIVIANDEKSQTIYTNFTYQPRIEADGLVSSILIIAIDVTAEVIARKKIEESESKLRTLILSAPPAIGMFVGRDLIIETPNQAFIDVIGKGNDIEGKSLKEVMPELESQPFLKLLDDVYTSGKIFQTESAKLEIFKNGIKEEKYFNITFSPLFDETGNVYAIIDVSIDVTESVISRQKTEASEKELRDLINASPIGICVVGGSPIKAVEINERFLQISGKTREQFASMPYWEALHEVAHIFESELDKVFETGIRYTTEEHEMMLIRNGIEENIFLTFEYIPILDKNNIVSKVIVMSFEVTHQVEVRKKIEAAVTERTRELAEANNNLQRSNAELEQFAHIASHDLQEPVRKISTYANMLEMNLGEKADTKSKKYLDKISVSADRMGALIRDVLSFSEVSHNVGPMVEVDLNKLIKEIEVDYELQIDKIGAVIEYKNLPKINAVPSQMLQLFSNLMSNSLKYVNENVIPHIIITATILPVSEVKLKGLIDDKKYYSIEFSDNGIGFDDHQKDRIFKIFQRLHGKTEFEGTGIGLALCRKIVYNHNGDISARPGKNRGAVFTIILPA